MQEAEGTYLTDRDAWNDYRQGQEFEHLLIDRKTTWLLTTQALLFAAYGISIRSDGSVEPGKSFREITAGAGMTLAVISFLGVVSIVVAKWIHWQKYKKYLSTQNRRPPGPYADELPWGAATWATPMTLLPDLSLPFVFFVARCLLL